ncbi:MAG: aminopeptidase [Betaproteobacteria bacterium]|nr:aminopeptidase [Betaproteobacteria bacterium]
MVRVKLMGLLVVAALAAGCSNIGYYLQSMEGQMQILQESQSIADVIADPKTPPAVKAKLTRLLEIRDFASRELKLPDNLSYRGYADLRRQYVVWNVFAAAEFSVKPQQWCFPIAGCVGYRGYFAQADAEAFARELRNEGLDVYVSGVPAYSTLGWFNDPVLNTFVHYPEYELARLIFHELAHQVAYAENDSKFNESFAVAVELEGVRRWIAAYGDDKMRADFERSLLRRTQFTELVLRYRSELGALYRSRLAPDAMRSRKAAAFAAMKQDYQRLKTEWGGFAGYDRFINSVNNANLASVAIYHALVPQFQQMIARHNGDLAAFYGEVKRLVALNKNERTRMLAGSTQSEKLF